MGALVTNLGAFIAFTLVSSVTPGPNNLMEINVGVTRGWRAALRTAAGVSIGWGIQLLACGFGLGELISAVPGLHVTIEALGLAYLCGLATRLTFTRKLGVAASPRGFLGALSFQWINPKAISMSLSIAALFVVRSGHLPFASVLFVALSATVLNYPCVAAWGVFGSLLAPRLHDERAIVRFNRAAALVLVATIVWVAATSSW